VVFQGGCRSTRQLARSWACWVGGSAVWIAALTLLHLHMCLFCALCVSGMCHGRVDGCICWLAPTKARLHCALHTDVGGEAASGIVSNTANRNPSLASPTSHGLLVANGCLEPPLRAFMRRCCHIAGYAPADPHLGACVSTRKWYVHPANM
jgi:hypothetical protein